MTAPTPFPSYIILYISNNNIYLVWPLRGSRLHRTTAHSAGCGVVQAELPITVSQMTRSAIEPAESGVVENLRGGERLRPRFGGGLPCATHVPR
jgi:hypothetical protein